jgi:hypothetical protein
MSLTEAQEDAEGYSSLLLKVRKDGVEVSLTMRDGHFLSALRWTLLTVSISLMVAFVLLYLVF